LADNFWYAAGGLQVRQRIVAAIDFSSVSIVHSY
jgi:hypothetical protein